jgi:hypothetical protein
MIELLVVPDCPHQVAAEGLVRQALADTGVRSSVSTSVLHTDREAHRRGIAGSPTFLIDGRDPFAPPSDGGGLACRLYPTPEGLAGIPALADLRQALKRAADR